MTALLFVRLNYFLSTFRSSDNISPESIERPRPLAKCSITLSFLSYKQRDVMGAYDIILQIIRQHTNKNIFLLNNLVSNKVFFFFYT